VGARGDNLRSPDFIMWDRHKPTTTTTTSQQRAGGSRLDERIMAFQAAANKPPARGYSYSIKGGPPPPRPPREYMESQ
jgi:hypothetical protein